jgi:hypothetical protein
MYMRVGLLERVEELWGAAARCVVTFWGKHGRGWHVGLGCWDSRTRR